MRNDIHPKWYPDAKTVCLACGTEWSIPSTLPSQRIDICGNCHPFYTGEQKIVDTEGMVDKFMSRLRARDERVAQVRAKEEARINADIPLEELGIGKRYIQIMNEAGIHLVSDLIRKLDAEGDEGILALPGIGMKVLTDAKRAISERGYQIVHKEA